MLAIEGKFSCRIGKMSLTHGLSAMTPPRSARWSPSSRHAEPAVDGLAVLEPHVHDRGGW
jgi:hypothetical protein